MRALLLAHGSVLSFAQKSCALLIPISSLWRRAASVAVDSYQSLLLTPVVVVVVVVAHCT